MDTGESTLSGLKFPFLDVAHDGVQCPWHCVLGSVLHLHYEADELHQAAIQGPRLSLELENNLSLTKNPNLFVEKPPPYNGGIFVNSFKKKNCPESWNFYSLKKLVAH